MGLSLDPLGSSLRTTPNPNQHHWQGVLGSALDAVGHTPLIHLQRIQKQEKLQCNLMAKCEFFSVGGSVKDRIAKLMVLEAENDGTLIPGKSVVIEPTSGNTGIGLALACALKGYQCIITLPAKMSLEKEVMLRALGAEIVRTPTEAAWDSPESHIGVANALKHSIPHAVILDQYANPNNPLAHYNGTYSEIMYALETSTLPHKDISLFAAGAGTGGTITGIARAIRDSPSQGGPGIKRTKIIAIDPEGSILGGGEPGNYEVEGIGYVRAIPTGGGVISSQWKQDFFPNVLDPNPPLIDEWVKTNDKEAFAMTKRLIRTEGLFVGGSSGSALSGALRYLHSPSGQSIAQNPEANVVILLADGVRNYMSKPWLVETTLHDPAGEELRGTIRGVLGRDLGDVRGVVREAEEEGRRLDRGEGLGMRDEEEVGVGMEASNGHDEAAGLGQDTLNVDEEGGVDGRVEVGKEELKGMVWGMMPEVVRTF